MSRPGIRLVFVCTCVGLGALLAGPSASAQSDGPDVIYSDCDDVRDWGALGGIRAYSLQSQTCNIGDTDLEWNNQGPLLAMNAYQLRDGRLMQIGMSWVKNATFAIAGSGCAFPCQGGGGSILGPGCQDVYSASYNGGHSRLGPRSQVNAFTGDYPGPSGGSGSAIYKRLQIAETHLSPAVGLYFIEGHYVASDEAAAGNAMNNASYKRVTVDASMGLDPEGSMYETVPAINAWHDHGLGVDIPDLSVEIVDVDVPDEGRFQVASKVTDLGGGMWRYDYAIRNHNSHRSAGSFSVPIMGASVSNVGFHDVDYHSGEPFDNTDWTGVATATDVTWSSPETFAQNPNSNALRFATMYNFWFDADVAPVQGMASIGLFRPDAGGPDSVNVAVPIPGFIPGDPAGAVPDGHLVAGSQLLVAKDGDALDLSWGPSCLATDVNYAVYEGEMGEFTSHRRKTCTTGGAQNTTISPRFGDTYYLVVPLSANREGSYGTDSEGFERPSAQLPCEPQEIGDCP